MYALREMISKFNMHGELISLARLLQINNEIIKQFSIRHTRHSYGSFEGLRTKCFIDFFVCKNKKFHAREYFIGTSSAPKVNNHKILHQICLSRTSLTRRFTFKAIHIKNKGKAREFR